MKFKLLEYDTDKIRQEHANKFYNFIKNNCQEIIKESKNIPVYRGMRPPSGSSPPGSIMTPKSNRKPRTTHPKVQIILDDLFYKKFGWFPRKTGVFGTGLARMAGVFGNIYRIYPTDNYKYLWSPEVSDLFDVLEYDEGGYINKSGLKDLKKIINSYQENNLPLAIQSGHEIMFSCDKYAAELIK